MLKIDFTTRAIPKSLWRTIWRQLRIVNREHKKAWQDQLIFGTGYLEVGPQVPDFIRCVPPQDVVIDYRTEPA